MHPLLRLLSTQPELLGSHAQAYSELLSMELRRQARSVGRRTLWIALALCFLGVTCILGGAATMLWALHTLSTPQVVQIPLALLVVPSVPAVLASFCLWSAHRCQAAAPLAFAELRRQGKADMALWREMAAQ
jgi:hypothetical protein